LQISYPNLSASLLIAHRYAYGTGSVTDMHEPSTNMINLFYGQTGHDYPMIFQRNKKVIDHNVRLHLAGKVCTVCTENVDRATSSENFENAKAMQLYRKHLAAAKVSSVNYLARSLSRIIREVQIS